MQSPSGPKVYPKSRSWLATLDEGRKAVARSHPLDPKSKAYENGHERIPRSLAPHPLCGDMGDVMGGHDHIRMGGRLRRGGRDQIVV